MENHILGAWKTGAGNEYFGQHVIQTSVSPLQLLKSQSTDPEMWSCCILTP